MKHETSQTLINRLDALLEKERRALLAGDLDMIGKLLTRKEMLFDALAELEPANQSDLLSLQTKVDRNQALLDGALQGIRKVANRMSTFRKIRRSLETYDAEGRKKAIPGELDHKVEKRA